MSLNTAYAAYIVAASVLRVRCIILGILKIPGRRL